MGPSARRGVVDLAMIAAEAVDTTEPLGVPRHVRCVFSHNGPALLTGTASVVAPGVNLVSTPFYTEPDTTVEIEVGSEGTGVPEVRDRGPGIAADERDRFSNASCA
jgi:hypothetical protein